MVLLDLLNFSSQNLFRLWIVVSILDIWYISEKELTRTTKITLVFCPPCDTRDGPVCLLALPQISVSSIEFFFFNKTSKHTQGLFLHTISWTWIVIEFLTSYYKSSSVRMSQFLLFLTNPLMIHGFRI